MTTQVEQKEEIKKQIVDYAIQSVEELLKEHPDVEFNAFAFCCDAKDAEIDIWLNTELDFQNTLIDYQKEHLGQNLSEQEIRALKYNTSKWTYFCPGPFYAFTEEEFDEIFMKLSGYEDDDALWEDAGTEEKPLWKEFLNNLLELFTESLVEFTKTETYKKIPKTREFVTFCIDYKEEFEYAIARLGKYK